MNSCARPAGRCRLEHPAKRVLHHAPRSLHRLIIRFEPFPAGSELPLPRKPSLPKAARRESLPSAAALPRSPAAALSQLSAVPLLDRDHSILAFNERVLDWACRPEVPLLERLRYVCIVSSNLDEFFEVRAEPHLSARQAKERKGPYTVATFESLAAAAGRLV
ncbi:MAG: hypothetical protein IAE92_17300, partial [Burkholderiaceae bacterium]|nr:hypothetical protein [Burkholderiaceae bacterium]